MYTLRKYNVIILNAVYSARKTDNRINKKDIVAQSSNATTLYSYEKLTFVGISKQYKYKSNRCCVEYIYIYIPWGFIINSKDTMTNIFKRYFLLYNVIFDSQWYLYIYTHLKRTKWMVDILFYLRIGNIAFLVGSW